MDARQPGGWFVDPNDASLLRWWNGSEWTQHYRPRAPVPAPPAGRPAPATSGPTGMWYFVITLASCGLLAAVPFFHAASRLDRPRLRAVGAGVAAASLLSLVLIGMSPEDVAGSPTGWTADAGGTVAVAILIVAPLLQIGLRREVYGQTTVSTPAPLDRNQIAVTDIEGKRRRRLEARRLAEKDPMMARELGIGRPGTTHLYDDGGLLDLNCATVEELSSLGGLPRQLADQVVAARGELGRFLHVEDALHYGQVDEEHASMLRERGIVIADR